MSSEEASSYARLVVPPRRVHVTAVVAVWLLCLALSVAFWLEVVLILSDAI